MKFETKAIHSSYDCDEHNRALMPPIYQNSMFAMHEIGEQIPYRYSRLSNPTRQVLEDTVADLEHGAAGFAFSSGMAGIDAVFRTFLQPGDTIIAVADIYGGAYDLLNDVYAKWGVNVVFADLGEPEKLDELLAQHKVKMLWLETPSNPLLRLVDVPVLAAKAKAAGALVGIDNTFATPYLQNPLDMGCDIVFHSATKYLCGHSDVLMGVVVVKTKELAKPLHTMMVDTGAIAAPMDCWLVLRGIKTLALRMKAHCENALEIAKRMEAHPAVEKVFYPGLPSHEHYALAQKQMPKGVGGVVTVYLKNDSREAANSVIKNMKMVKMASSLGGVESLVNHCYSQSHSGVPHDVKMQMGIKAGLLRFSIGIEDADDIWADIFAALDTTL
ncbi:trans-sulfuration enzyme family protein [Neisseria perflava]|uniref:trans-sulfuration enzyme family protein n=1 Tax=Neisseria perflava TaxID=33053 RepID=UPI00209FB491|nr:PLP-dependent aspartate aminotransferase family protein [Neisseria perflava]MCP1660623.1 cystathionine beta-lyase/cystathionine gamma-synthase [Neisseria perflava]MCP1772377.1 cystathionine beta-lyase/cystathionine gamma-synthase [Neisseria perflava]